MAEVAGETNHTVRDSHLLFTIKYLQSRQLTKNLRCVNKMHTPSDWLYLLITMLCMLEQYNTVSVHIISGWNPVTLLCKRYKIELFIASSQWIPVGILGTMGLDVHLRISLGTHELSVRNFMSFVQRNKSICYRIVLPDHKKDVQIKLLKPLS